MPKKKPKKFLNSLDALLELAKEDEQFQHVYDQVKNNMLQFQGYLLSDYIEAVKSGNIVEDSLSFHINVEKAAIDRILKNSETKN